MAPGAGRKTCSSAQCRPSIRQPSFATAATFSTAGFLDLSNPFHVAQGSDGHSCESCHLPHDDARQIITRFLSPNPDEEDVARAQASDVGRQGLVPYTADSVFYKATRRE
jgi:hypothetical protein